MPIPPTLVHALHAAPASETRGFHFVSGRGEDVRLSYAELAAEADRLALKLREAGATPGERIGLIFPDPRDFVVSFFGALRAGLVPVPMYPPLSMGKLDAYMDSATRILLTAGARRLLVADSMAKLMWALVGSAKLADLHTVSGLAGPAKPMELPLPEPGDVCFLQFTSGSTSDPKGVVVSHANLMANTRAQAVDGAALDPETDRLVSWLPLYHDMGLIGFVVTPVVMGMDTWLIPTMSFVRQPNLWMETVHRVGGTISFAPNFAFALAARRATDEHLARWDLSKLRLVGCGAEPIQAGTLRNFHTVFAKAGMPATAALPAYGMAEATLAVSFKPRDNEFRSLRVDAVELCESGRVVEVPAEFSGPTQEFVSCGHVLPHHRVDIVDDAGALLGEGVEGELVVYGPSVTAGYYENPASTAASFVGGGVRTGDLGFVHDGELYVSGRLKDLVILNGKNVHPQSIEWVAAEVPGVRRGNVVAFSRPGENTEELVLAVERSTDGPAPDVLAKAVAAHVQESMGLAVADVVVIQAGALPKTSSGKLQRRKTRDHYLAGALGTEGVRTMGAGAERLTAAKHLARSLFARVKHGITGG